MKNTLRQMYTTFGKQMKYKYLGNSQLKVSSICLGTMTFGEQSSKNESYRMMDYAYDEGVNFFDTAEIYPVYPKKETAGKTEEIIGNWLKKNRIRKSILLDTKVTGRNFGEIKSVGGKRLIPQRIISAAEKSLKRLKTDYIDTFYIHWPDRFTNNFDRLYYFPSNDPKFIPLEVQFEAILKLKKSGKIRNFGISNE